MKADLTTWLMENYGQEVLRSDPDLLRMKRALAHLLPQFKQSQIVTIAGTNGKGETTLWLSRYLKQQKHCCWISPHIERLTERFRDEQGEIDQDLLATLIDRCHQMVKSEALELSYYEFLFLVFCTWASSRNSPLLLLEVGLGGRMDAVNVFDADLVLLPSLSRDHQEFLGPRYDLILKEKLALLRSKSLLLSYLSLNYLHERTFEACQAAQCEWIDLSAYEFHQDYQFSARNQLLAYAAFCRLQGVPTGQLRERSTYEKWSCSEECLEHRGEVVKRGAQFSFFGSHNVDGMRKLIQFLHSENYNFHRFPFDAVIVAFSRREERDLRVLLKMIKSSRLGPVLVTSFAHPKAASFELMQKLAFQEGLTFVHDIKAHTHDFQDAAAGSRRVLVTGSYYFLGFFKSLLTGRS